MRPRDMTVRRRDTGGWQVTFENDRELVTIEASAEQLNAWARVLAPRTAGAIDGDAGAGSGRHTPAVDSRACRS